MTARAVQLVASCIILGVGVALLLDSRLGADGFSTLINGLRLWSGTPFWVVNLVVGVLFVLIAVAGGLRPGLGTITQVVVVGFTVSLLLPVAPSPSSFTGRGVELGVALVLLAVGVAGYLASNLGAGPAEAVAIAWDPPVAFRFSYSAVQIGGALIGWSLGADVGIATVIVVVFIGPVVVLTSRIVFRTGPSARARPAASAVAAK